jgi:cytoskeletal protein RodZ
MPTVAEQLRAAREARKLTIDKVADLTKVRTDHLRALEDGNYNAFSAIIYIRGSVKLYATLLKLDVPQVMAALDAELKATEKFKELPALVEQKKGPLEHIALLAARLSSRNITIGLTALGAVVVLALLVAGWRHHSKAAATVPNLPPAVYQSTNNGDTLPLPRK